MEKQHAGFSGTIALAAVRDGKRCLYVSHASMYNNYAGWPATWQQLGNSH